MGRRRLGLVASMTLITVLAACGGPSPDEVRQRTSSILDEMITESADAVEVARRMEALSVALDGLSSVSTALGWSSASSSSASKTDSTGSVGTSSGTSAADVAAQLDDILGRFVFAEGNVESTGGGSTTFLLRGSVVCGAASSVSTSGTSCIGGTGLTTRCSDAPATSSSTQPKAECIELVDRLQIRIVATLVGERGLDLELRIGPSADIYRLQLRPGAITLKASLAGARAAVVHLATVLGEPLPDLPQVVEGVIALSLTRNAPHDLTAALSVLEAVEVQGMGSTGSYKLHLDARDPALSAHFDGAAPRLTMDVDWGATELLVPARALFQKATGQLHVVLSGLTASASVGEGDVGLKIKNVGLGAGPSSAKLDAQTLVEVNLNPTAGRAFALDVVPRQGLPSCTVDPQLELQVKLALAPLQPYLSSPLDAWVKNDSYRVLLQKPGGRPEVTAAPETGTFPGGVKVLQGTLTLESFVQPAKVVVPAGSCLVLGSSSTPDGHPLLGRLAAVTCP
jgi:hypothetical protein